MIIALLFALIFIFVRPAQVGPLPVNDLPGPPQQDEVTPSLAPVPADSYDMGNPTLREVWVDPVHGNDGNNGSTPETALRSLTAAWSLVPATMTGTGYSINLLPGTYPCEPEETNNCLNVFNGRTGTYQFPIILRAYSGPGTVIIRGGLDIWDVSYLYLLDITLAGGDPIPVNHSGNNLLHLAGMDHILVRGVTLDGPDCAADTCNNLQEVLKANQVQYLYVENSEIGGAWHTSVDYFAVQYGHFLNNDVHTAGQWCMYIKGGTSYLRIEANEMHNCQLGFSAGQSANFPVMIPPWLQYEAYDIKFINNILHDLPGTGLSVAGGYNILFAYNTLYRVGTSTDIGYPLLEAVRGERGCSATTELPNPLSTCNNFVSLGGWGPNFLTDNMAVIPNRYVYVYNNVFYNPAPAKTQWTHFNIQEPIVRPAGFPNLPNPLQTDDHLSIRGNVIWNGDASMPLGIEDTQACTAGNPTCNEAQLRAENSINTLQPAFANAAGGDFHPDGDWVDSAALYAIPDFVWEIASVPGGDTSNAIPTDFEGVTRSSDDAPGAYSNVSNLPHIFQDVPATHWAWQFIERLYNNGVTGGCGASPLIYCPSASVTRAQMAVFLLKSMHGPAYIPADATGEVFNDVPADHMFVKWIEQLYAEGITGGCGGENYCPDTPVSRDQMAVFLLRAKHGNAFTPLPAAGIFADVPIEYWAADWIEQLAAEGITGGCGGGNYCPATIVRRDQMAVFLVVAFNLP
jgi:hypothetical protein